MDVIYMDGVGYSQQEISNVQYVALWEAASGASESVIDYNGPGFRLCYNPGPGTVETAGGVRLLPRRGYAELRSGGHRAEVTFCDHGGCTLSGLPGVSVQDLVSLLVAEVNALSL